MYDLQTQGSDVIEPIKVGKGLTKQQVTTEAALFTLWENNTLESTKCLGESYKDHRRTQQYICLKVMWNVFVELLPVTVNNTLTNQS